MMNMASATPSQATTSLQEKQKENLLRMLDFNAEATDSSLDSADRWGEQWKVLIYDRVCRDIISPILKLHELRKKGVTLHMLIDTERDAIPDVPAIYFVEPTRANIERIVDDCSKELYSAAHLNFAYPLSRESLELLARLAVEKGCASMIAKVFDQHTNFVSLEPSLFSLQLANSYRAYNDPALPDTQIEESMSAIVRGIFSVLATMGKVPVIRCPNNDGPSRMVAEQLTQLLRDYLSSRKGVFGDTAAASFQRPVLIIMDRNEDLASSLHHPSTYQALVDDMLKISLNRVKVQVKPSAGEQTNPSAPPRVVEKTYDLDITSDAFFQAHAGSLFPDAIDANEEEMKQVTKKEEQIRAKTGGGDAFGSGTKDLVAAVDTLPALLEKKKMLEIHTNIFQATFDGVTARHIPSFSMLEQKMIDGLHVDRQEVLSLLSGQETGSIHDKLRLLMIFYLTSGASSAEMADLEQAYQQFVSGSSTLNPAVVERCNHAWSFLKRHAAFQRHNNVSNALRGDGSGSTPPASGAGAATSINSAANISKFKGLAQGFLAQAAASVRNFLPENKKLHVTRVTDAICELRPNTEDETFLYLDPKIKAATSATAVPRQRTPFREAMVFVIGGGNYNEYQNLMAYAKAAPPAVGPAAAATPSRVVWYGCTELLSPEEFLQQLGSISVS
ncbi:hypothetical protein ATCC90586_003518 [Pythium insidiosum]|nr:hypothetical protein ATCC90586_003518 [Pythium insidiosum]